MLELKGLTKTADGAVHIQPTSLKLEKGSLTVLLGPTLSGKTSLMRLIAGLDRPTSGSVWFDGKDVTGTAVRKRNVAMVYQQFINYPGLSVRENIASPLRVRRADKAAINAEVSRAAELLHLTPYLDRFPLELSGGQQQRVALARALVKKADIVLLDEPLANLDYKLREELRNELPRLFADSGAVVIYATTESTEALLLGGNTATLNEGRITQVGPTAAVYRNPQDLVTARTFSDPPLNVLRAVDPYSSADRLAFRAHHLRPGECKNDSDAMTYSVKVVSSEITGSETYVHVATDTDRWVMLEHGIHARRSGDLLDVHVRHADLMAFDADGRRMPTRQAT